MPPFEERPPDDGLDLQVFISILPAVAVAVADGTEPRDLWIAAALSLTDGRVYGLGLYDAPPGDEGVKGVLAGEPARPGPLGALWSCVNVRSVSLDTALFWTTPEAVDWLQRRKITLHAVPPTGPAANDAADRHFVRMAASLSAALKRQAHSRISGQRALVAPQAAADAARAWRLARHGDDPAIRVG